MPIEESMKTFVVSIDVNNTVRYAAELMIERHVGTLPVVDDSGRLIGLLTLTDVLQLFMPGFLSLLHEIDFVPDFGALEEPQLAGEALETPVEEVMRPPVSIVTGTGLLRAWATIEQHRLLDVPVVDEHGQLMGIVSRVDIGTAFLKQWLAR